jgi:hypothetical protein
VKRPVCVHCGRPYGRRNTTAEELSWALDETRPTYKGNGIVVKEGEPYKTANRDTVRAVTMMSVNPEVRAKQEARLAAMPEASRWTATREVWDGESWFGGYKPFCTLRCALAYAREAYNRE